MSTIKIGKCNSAKLIFLSSTKHMMESGKSRASAEPRTLAHSVIATAAKHGSATSPLFAGNAPYRRSRNVHAALSRNLLFFPQSGVNAAGYECGRPLCSWTLAATLFCVPTASAGLECTCAPRNAQLSFALTYICRHATATCISVSGRKGTHANR